MARLCKVVISLALSCVFVQTQTTYAAVARGQKPRARVAGSPSSAAASQKPAEKQEEDCGCEASAPPGVLALVNGVKVGVSEIYDPIKDKVQELQNQIVAARQRELELQISTKLFEAEAKRRGTTLQKLIQSELAGKVKDPTEAEIQTFYEQNRARIEGQFTEVRTSIATYIRNQRLSEETTKLTQRLGAGRVRILVEKVTPPKNTADRARVLATVNGQRITSGDIEEALAPMLFNIEEQIYEIRKKPLDAKINDILLAQEANKRGTTAEALFESEVSSKIRKVTDEEVQTFYRDNKERLGRPLYQARAQIVEYLENLLQTEALGVYADQLRKGAKVQVFLKQPDPPVVKIAIDDQPWMGGANAPVTLVEFTDYECPTCARTQPLLEEVIKEYGDKVKLVVRDFPLDQHAHSFKAAEAAEAAREQGKYWQYAALLFKNQKALEVENLKTYASQLGLDRAKFDQALDSGKYAEDVKRDLRDGNAIGINSTPTVFINGKRVREKTHEALKAAIEIALKEQRSGTK